MTSNKLPRHLQETEAFTVLVKDYLTQRKVSKKKQDRVEKFILDELKEDSGNITDLKNILLDNSVVTRKNYHDIDKYQLADPETGKIKINFTHMNAYLDAQILYCVADDIRTTKENLTPAQCRFAVSPELLEELVDEYGVSLAEEMAEQGMYANME